MDFVWNTAMWGNHSGSVKLKAECIFQSLVYVNPTLNLGLEFSSNTNTIPSLNIKLVA